MKAEEARHTIDAQLEELGQALASGQSDKLRAFLATMARFHRYSLGNTLLIMVQRPDATHVAGFHAWLKLGRSVKKGEKGIAILAPIAPKAKGDKDPSGEKKQDSEDRSDEDERPLRFRVAYVFDVSQTEGEPLPEFARPSGDPGDYLDRLRSLVFDMEIVLEYRDDLGGAHGASAGGLIAIKKGLMPAEEFSTLVHELAHECLHKGEARLGTTVTSRELEAEAVAFVVGQAVGLDCGSASWDYIQLYGGDRLLLAASLDRIRTTSQRILGSLFAEKPEPEVVVEMPPSPPPTLERFRPSQPSLFD